MALEGVLYLTVASSRRAGRCPVCQKRSWRRHSQYERTIAHLPVTGHPVVLKARVRRFFCPRRRCRRKVFAERLVGLAAAHARRTDVLRGAQQRIGLQVGGNPGARVAAPLGMATSPSTLLRLAKAMPVPEPQPVRVLGVDDWAKRRGHSYGTILCDLERGCVVELLPDRSGDTLAQWLRAHPGVEIISRDRGGPYARGAAEGAPNAQQVADRFHLCKNLGEALDRHLQGQRSFLRRIAQSLTPPAETPCESGDVCANAGPAQTMRRLTRAQAAKEERRERRLARFEEVRRLSQDGLSQRAIADRTGLSRVTVGRFLRADAFPERAALASVLDPFKAHLLQRIQQGCVHGGNLYEELRAQGYKGSRSRVYDYVSTFRHCERSAITAMAQQHANLSPRAARWLLMRDAEELDQKETAQLTALCAGSELLRKAHALCQRFRAMLHERNKDLLLGWIHDAKASGVPELAGFADGLCEDLSAVEAGIALRWSNGPVEGQVNRLKMIKRRAYGRAGFQLLRRQVILGD